MFPGVLWSPQGVRATPNGGEVYDNLAAMKKFEPKHRQKRSGVEIKGKTGRRNRKDLRHRQAKLSRRGSERQEMSSAGEPHCAQTGRCLRAVGTEP